MVLSELGTGLRLLAEPIGSRVDYLTSRIVAGPGDEIVWRVTHQPAPTAAIWKRFD